MDGEELKRLAESMSRGSAYNVDSLTDGLGDKIWFSNSNAELTFIPCSWDLFVR
jgi:hypothetical protein